MKKIRVLLLVLCLGCLAAMFSLSGVSATPAKAPERIRAVMVGDRLVDVALRLGVIPEAMSVRASMWPKAPAFRLGTQLLGCPNRVTRKAPDTVAKYMKEHGVTRLILEKSAKFCLYMNKVDPCDVAELVKDVPGVTIEYVDFTKGVVPAIHEAAALLGREERGREVAAAYEAAMKKVEAAMPKSGLNRRVLVLNGNYSETTGKCFVRIEAPGGYSDQYILGPLGCENAAGAMITDTMRVAKGHVSGGRLGGLEKACPDVIVATGDGYAVQMALRMAVKRNPSLAEIPAIKNGNVFNLPFYGDSSVLEYPQIFRQWSDALMQ